MPSFYTPSRPKAWSESQIADIESADFQVAEIDSVKGVVNFFQTNVFAPENLADEDPVLMPADILCIAPNVLSACVLPMMETACAGRVPHSQAPLTSHENNYAVCVTYPVAPLDRLRCSA